MGLSASQGRMLSLTSRLSDLEYSAQNISNQKIRLADRSEDASKNYLDALNAKKITVYNAETNTNIDATLQSIYSLNTMDSNGRKRIIVDSQGNVICPNGLKDANSSIFDSYFKQTGKHSVTGKSLNQTEISNAYTNSQNVKKQHASAFESEDEFLNFMFNGNIPKEGDEKYSSLQYLKNVYSGLEAYLQSFGYTSADSTVQSGSYYQGDVSNLDGIDSGFAYDGSMLQTLALAFFNGGVGLNPDVFNNSAYEKNSNSTEWLYEQLSLGNVFLVEYNENGGEDKTGAWERISWSSGDSQLVTETDDIALAKAEAEYETAMSEIQGKDKRFDLELQNVDTEHSALQKQIDSVSKVMDGNIERTFKLFS